MPSASGHTCKSGSDFDGRTSTWSRAGMAFSPAANVVAASVTEMVPVLTRGPAPNLKAVDGGMEPIGSKL